MFGVAHRQDVVNGFGERDVLHVAQGVSGGKANLLETAISFVEHEEIREGIHTGDEGVRTMRDDLPPVLLGRLVERRLQEENIQMIRERCQRDRPIGLINAEQVVSGRWCQLDYNLIRLVSRRDCTRRGTKRSGKQNQDQDCCEANSTQRSHHILSFLSLRTPNKFYRPPMRTKGAQ